MVSNLSTRDAQAVRDAVAAAEAGTTGEIVTIVTRRSASYTAAILGIAVAASFIAAIVLHVTAPRFGVWTVLAAQAAVLIIVLALLRLTGTVPRLAPARLRHAHVRSLARAQFAELGLHNLPDRAAILILVSRDERCVEIIADTGIDAAVEAGHWDRMAAKLIAAIPRDGIAGALAGTVAACGVTLKTHFPAVGPRQNRFGDTPVEL